MAATSINIVEYIANRMAALGVAKYHFEPIKVLKQIASKVEIAAQNEYYYLITTAANMPNNLRIESDQHMLSNNDANTYGSFDFYEIHEFSGWMVIDPKKLAAACRLEFIRVVPLEYIPV